MNTENMLTQLFLTIWANVKVTEDNKTNLDCARDILDLISSKYYSSIKSRVFWYTVVFYFYLMD